MTIDQVWGLAVLWAKRIISAALLAVLLLTSLKLFGVSLYPIPSIGWQEFGVFIAGSAFALSKL
jgi:hypothetical protein